VTTSLNNQELDLDSAEFKKRLAVVTVTVLGLGAVGGLWLGMKIKAAERADARIEAQQEASGESAGQPSDQNAGSVTPPADKKGAPPLADE